jgi:hypothetical protein
MVYQHILYKYNYNNKRETIPLHYPGSTVGNIIKETINKNLI